MPIKANKTSAPLIPIMITCLGAVLIGFSPIFVRASDLGPMTTGFYRLLFSLPLLFMWMIWEKKANPERKLHLTKMNFLTLVLGGIFFAMDLAFWNWSIDYTVIVNATLFNNTSAFFVPFLMWMIFSEKMSARTIISAFFGFLGCILLVGESFTINVSNLIGDLVALFSGLMVTAYVITLKRVREHLPTGFLMFWTGIISLIGMGIFGILFGEPFWPLTRNDWISVLGQALLTHVLGQGLLAYSFGKISASYGALIMLLAPVSAAILGWAIHGEILSVAKLIGVSIIMASIVGVKRT